MSSFQFVLAVKYRVIFSILLIVALSLVSTEAEAVVPAVPAPYSWTIAYDAASEMAAPNSSKVLCLNGLATFSPTYDSSLKAATIDSTPANSNQRGCKIDSSLTPILDSTAYFSLNFTAKLISESHTSANNRAGFSIILLGSNHVGIELGFWTNLVWAQNQNFGNTGSPRGEEVTFNTSAAFVDYRLQIRNNAYYLYANDSQILTGSLRDYTGNGFDIIYGQSNYTFIGDDTTSAQAKVAFSALSIEASVIYEYVTDAGDTVQAAPALPVTLRQAVANAPTSGAIITFDSSVGTMGNPVSLSSSLTLNPKLRLQADCANPVKIQGGALLLGGQNLLKGLDISVPTAAGPGILNNSPLPPKTGNLLTCMRVKIT